MSQYVKVGGFYVLPGTPAVEESDGMPARDEVPHRTVNPGSVITLDDNTAKEFVRRGLGTFCRGPEFEAPYPGPNEDPEEGGRPDPKAPPERQDMAPKLARAEKAVAPAQRAGAI